MNLMLKFYKGNNRLFISQATSLQKINYTDLDLNNIKLNLNLEDIELGNLLSIIQREYSIDFSLETESLIKIDRVLFFNRSLKDLLEILYNTYHIHYEIKNDLIRLYSCKNEWKSYNVKFFYEEETPTNLNSLFENDDKIKPKQSLIFWKEFENNIKKITENEKGEYAIDKYNGLISVLGNCKLHNIIKNYIKQINSELYKQIKFKVTFINCAQNIDFDFDIINYITEFFNIKTIKKQQIFNLNNLIIDLSFESLSEIINNIILGLKNFTNNKFSYSIDQSLEINVLSQNTATIKNTYNKNLKKQSFASGPKNYDKTEYIQKPVGICVSLSPILFIENDLEKCLLKLRLSFSSENEGVDEKIFDGDLMTTLKLNLENDQLLIGRINLGHSVKKTGFLLKKTNVYKNEIIFFIQIAIV